MIKLIGSGGDPLYIAPEKVIAVYENENYTSVHVGEESVFPVQETATEVVKKVMDYRFHMMQYPVYLESDHRKGDYIVSMKVNDRVRKSCGLDGLFDESKEEAQHA